MGVPPSVREVHGLLQMLCVSGAPGDIFILYCLFVLFVLFYFILYCLFVYCLFSIVLYCLLAEYRGVSGQRIVRGSSACFVAPILTHGGEIMLHLAQCLAYL